MSNAWGQSFGKAWAQAWGGIVALAPATGGAPKRKIYVPTEDGVVQVGSITEASQLLAKPKTLAPLQPLATAQPAIRSDLDYAAIDAAMRAQIQAEMDDEEDLLMLFA